jgi:hypothetical protein
MTNETEPRSDKCPVVEALRCASAAVSVDEKLRWARALHAAGVIYIPPARTI